MLKKRFFKLPMFLFLCTAVVGSAVVLKAHVLHLGLIIYPAKSFVKTIPFTF